MSFSDHFVLSEGSISTGNLLKTGRFPGNYFMVEVERGAELSSSAHRWCFSWKQLMSSKQLITFCSTDTSKYQRLERWWVFSSGKDDCQQCTRTTVHSVRKTTCHETHKDEQWWVCGPAGMSQFGKRSNNRGARTAKGEQRQSGWM